MNRLVLFETLKQHRIGIRDTVGKLHFFPFLSLVVEGKHIKLFIGDCRESAFVIDVPLAVSDVLTYLGPFAISFFSVYSHAFLEYAVFFCKIADFKFVACFGRENCCEVEPLVVAPTVCVHPHV